MSKSTHNYYSHSEGENQNFDRYKKEVDLPEGAPDLGECDSFLRFVRFTKKNENGIQVGVVSDGVHDDLFYFDVAEAIFDKPEVVEFFEKMLGAVNALKSPLGDITRNLVNEMRKLKALEDCQCQKCKDQREAENKAKFN